MACSQSVFSLEFGWNLKLSITFSSCPWPLAMSRLFSLYPYALSYAWEKALVYLFRILCWSGAPNSRPEVRMLVYVISDCLGGSPGA